MTTLKYLTGRLEEVKDNDRFPTAFEVMEAWIAEFNAVRKNISETSLNQADKIQRQKKVIADILK